MLPSQYLSILVLDLVHALSLRLATYFWDLLTLGMDFAHDVIHVQVAAIVSRQKHSHFQDLGLQPVDLLFVDLPEEADLIIP